MEAAPINGRGVQRFNILALYGYLHRRSLSYLKIINYNITFNFSEFKF